MSVKTSRTQQTTARGSHKASPVISSVSGTAARFPRANDTSVPPPSLSIALFGGFQVALRGMPMRKLRTRQGNRLLALLVLNTGNEVDRRALAAQLWPDSTSDTAATALLRRALTDLRDALGTEEWRIESVSKFELRLNLSYTPGSDVFCDVLAFDEAIRQGTSDSFDLAISLYQGPLMPDLDAVSDPEGLIRSERDRREVVFLDALQRRAGNLRASGDIVSAIVDYRRLLAFDPISEPASRALMELLTADAGGRAGAIAEYHRLREALAKTLETEPERETVELFERIQAGKLTLLVPTAPPLSVAPPSHPHNLPARLTRFIGRETAREAVRGLMRQNRLLTLTGTGGAGKTRLAQEIARDVLPEYPGGVWQVELAPVQEPALIPQAVATALGIKERPGQPILASVKDFLASQRLFLLLDNCEHLLQACADLASSVLEACPDVTILATSRESLGMVGEQVYRVPSLELPPDLREGTAADAAIVAQVESFESVRLFADRAALIDSGFRITGENASVIARLCRRLDGIPLALELAAARLRAFSLVQIMDGLDDRLRLLADGNRSALPRQQTLRALIDWSHDLLDSEEKTLFARLSVFSGGWTLDAATSVCGDTPLAAETVLERLESLVSKSLVQPEEGLTLVDGTKEVRFRILETLRQYARDKQEERGDSPALHQRHGEWFLNLAEESIFHTTSEDQAVWLNRLEAEHDNFRAAMAYWSKLVQDASNASGPASGPIAVPETHFPAYEAALSNLRLSGALCRFWGIRGHITEGREFISRALPARAQILAAVDAAGNAENAREVREFVARALQGMANLALQQGDYDFARPFQEECLKVYRETGNIKGIANTLSNMAVVAARQNDLANAQTLWEEGLALQREIGANRGISGALTGLGYLAEAQNNYVRARALYEESLVLIREFGDKSEIAIRLLNLGNLIKAQGDNSAAYSAYKECLTLQRELGDSYNMATTLGSLSEIYEEWGRHAEAYAVWEEGFRLHYECGNKLGIVKETSALATIWIRERKLRQAAVLLAANSAWRESIGISLPQKQIALLAEQRAMLQEEMGDEAFDAARADGSAMAWEQMVKYALGETDAS